MYLFVYGTLRKGVNNRFARMLPHVARHAGEGWLSGRLYRISHYPGLVLTGGDRDRVRGDLYELSHAAATLRMLDAYEGFTAPHEFKRSTANVTLDGGTEIEATVYVYRRFTSGRQRIVLGDFLNPRLPRRVR